MQILKMYRNISPKLQIPHSPFYFSCRAYFIMHKVFEHPLIIQNSLAMQMLRNGKIAAEFSGPFEFAHTPWWECKRQLA